MSEHKREDGREQEDEREPGADELQEEQTGKGYGEDEGGRDEALEKRNFENL
jgi:hypothetical protein